MAIGIFQYKFMGNIEARSGCCSYHSGVCGCSCCDGTPLSDTCAPYYPNCNNSQPVEEPAEIVRPTIVPTRVPPVIMPTKRPMPTLIPTKRPLSTVEPTNVPTLAPTETMEVTPIIVVTVAPTQPEVLVVTKANEVKLIKHQSLLARFFGWLVGRK